MPDEAQTPEISYTVNGKQYTMPVVDLSDVATIQGVPMAAYKRLVNWATARMNEANALQKRVDKLEKQLGERHE